jgi:putrescine aminotransferase
VAQELIDPLRAYCAALLAAHLPGELQYAFFTNSGTESVEACLKFAMLATGRRHFIGVIGAFHGKTLGSLGGTSKSVFRKPFANALLPFTHIPVNDVEALRRAFESARFTGNDIAGVLLEPVLGEGGIHVLSDAFLRAARALCDEHGAALIFDEVQSGMGRTGKMWACEWAGVAPDLMAIGKAFGGGVQAAGAAVGTARMWEKYLDNPFLFTTTFGGSPVAMAAAIATMHVLESEDLIAAAATKGQWLLEQLRLLGARFPRIIKEARGRGLMLGLEFHSDEIGYAFARGVFSRGILLSGTLVNSRVLRVEPPLTITQEQMEVVLERFADTLAAMLAEGACLPSSGAVAATSAAAGGAGASSATTTTITSPATATAKPKVHLLEVVSPAAAAASAAASAPTDERAAAAATATVVAPAGSADSGEHEHADPHDRVPRRRGGRSLSECEGEGEGEGEGDDDAGTEVSSVSESSVEA